MFKHTKTALMAGLLALTVPGLAANSVAGLANPLDNSGGSARALGMGSAFVGVADDSSALLWNPAGLGGLKNVEIALHHNSWLAGIIQETGVLAIPMGPFGGLAASINYVNYGTFNGYDSNGARLGDYAANRYGVGLGWGVEIVPGLEAGVGLKGAMNVIADTSTSNLSADLGALWMPLEDVRLGIAYSNLGTDVAGYSQAAVLRLGGSFRAVFSPQNYLLLAASGSFEPGGVNRLQLGAEDMIRSFLALRVGYQQSLAETQIDGLSGLSLGVGLNMSGLGLDYAYLPYGDLGTTQRVSISYKFGQEDNANQAGN